MANELASVNNIKIDGVETADGRMKVDIGGANINATISDVSLKDVDVTSDKRLKVDSSPTIENFVFAESVTAQGSKIYSNLNKRTLTITFYGSGTSTFTAKLVSNGIKLPVQGVRDTGKTGLVDSANAGEIVTFDKPPGCDFELSWTTPVGGSVSAKAVVV